VCFTANLSVNVRLVVDRLALGQVLLQVLLFSPVSIIPSCLSKLLYHRFPNCGGETPVGPCGSFLMGVSCLYEGHFYLKKNMDAK
jgi:hypothetical protein